MGCQRPVTGAGSRSSGRRILAYVLSEVAFSPAIELPELREDWGNRVLEGTNRTVCTPGPRRKEQ